MRNWIEDENRFKLSGPPKWFLQRLKDFDPSLVILPSRQKMAYRLAPSVDRPIIHQHG